MYNTDSVQNTTFGRLFCDRAGIKPNVIKCTPASFFTIKNFIQNELGGAFLYSSL